MKNVHQTDFEIVSKFYESVLEKESYYQEYNYFSKQTELTSIDEPEFKLESRF